MKKLSLLLLVVPLLSASAGLAPISVLAQTSGVASVSITDNLFTPKNLTVITGTTVKWTNTGTHTHTVTEDNVLFNSGNLATGGVYSFTFSVPGVYPYHCQLHGGVGGVGMSGTITVSAGVQVSTSTQTSTSAPTGSSIPSLTQLQAIVNSLFGQIQILQAQIAALIAGSPSITSAPVIASVSPSSGPVGTPVTVTGANFTQTGNTVNFGGIVMSNIPAGPCGSTCLGFTVPSGVPTGTTNLSVSNINGVSNPWLFTVTSYGISNKFQIGDSVITNRALNARSAASLSSAILTLIPAGTTGRILQGPVSADGYIWYQVNYNVDVNGLVGWSADLGLDKTGGGTACSAEAKQCPDGSYVSRVAPSCEFAECPSTGSVSISSINPSSGSIGASVTINGTGFTATNNIIKIDSGYLSNFYNSIASAGLTGQSYITFTVPEGLSPCQPNGGCAGYYQLFPGTHQVSVQNANGTSNSVTFTITSSNLNSLQVLSPNGGETWTKGTTQTIKWQDNTPVPLYSCAAGVSCPTRSYDIKLAPYYPPCTGGVCPLYAYHGPYTIANGISGSGYIWSVGNILDIYLAASTAPDGSYTVQVCQSGSTTCDSSDAPFTVKSSSTGSVSLTGINPTLGPVGTGITLTGTGLTQDNTIHFVDANGGNGYIQHVSDSPPPCAYGISCADRIYFTLPATMAGTLCPTGSECPAYVYSVSPGTYKVSVINTNGTSNSMAFTVTSSQTGGVSLTSINPTSGPVGTQVTLTGTGFTSTGNSISINGIPYAVTPLSSSNGTALSFAIPSVLCNQLSGSLTACPITLPGTYNLSVQNTNGTSNTKTFTVTSGTVTGYHLTCQNYACVSVVGDGPSTCTSNADCQVSTYGYHFTCQNNACVSVVGDGPSTCATNANCTSTTTCPPPQPTSFCDGTWQTTQMGIANNGTNCTIGWMCVAARTGSVSITSLNPTSGPVGAGVTIMGTGFTSTGNKVKFGSLGSENNPSYSLNSYDGKTLVFAVPANNYLACWYGAFPCEAPLYLTQPGTYQVSVINANGTSNAVNFTVVSGSASTAGSATNLASALSSMTGLLEQMQQLILKLY